MARSVTREERLCALRQKARERDRTAVRKMWATTITASSILLTITRRGSITLRAVREVWGVNGEKITRHLVEQPGPGALAIEDAERAEVHLHTLKLGPNEPLILTKYGRELVNALEHLADFGAHFDAGRSKKARKFRGR